jgi:hypothetical protein
MKELYTKDEKYQKDKEKFSQYLMTLQMLEQQIQGYFFDNIRFFDSLNSRIKESGNELFDNPLFIWNVKLLSVIFSFDR